mgnify:CR=1 FL=1
MAQNSPVTIQVNTRSHTDFVNIGSQIQDVLPDTFTGACLLFCQHTTAGLTINENADPDVVKDMIMHLDDMVPWRHAAYRHTEGNSAARIKSSLVGVSLMLPVQRGRPVLGTWQSVYFCEFDGPRSRRVVVQLLASPADGAEG